MYKTIDNMKRTEDILIFYLLTVPTGKGKQPYVIIKKCDIP